MAGSNTAPPPAEGRGTLLDSYEPPATRHVIVFGETGAGKSSIINMLAGEGTAVVSNSARGCTFESKAYSAQIQGLQYTLHDTAGLNEWEKGRVSGKDAVRNLYQLVKNLDGEGISLLVYCIRGPRIKESMVNNYRMFYQAFCQEKVSIVIAITGLENEDSMDEWWDENGATFAEYGMTFTGYACLTATKGKMDRLAFEYAESKQRLQDVVVRCCLSKPWKIGGRSWLMVAVKRVWELFAQAFDVHSSQAMEYATDAQGKASESKEGKVLRAGRQPRDTSTDIPDPPSHAIPAKDPEYVVVTHAAPRNATSAGAPEHLEASNVAPPQPTSLPPSQVLGESTIVPRSESCDTTFPLPSLGSNGRDLRQRKRDVAPTESGGHTETRAPTPAARPASPRVQDLLSIPTSPPALQTTAEPGSPSSPLSSDAGPTTPPGNADGPYHYTRMPGGIQSAETLHNTSEIMTGRVEDVTALLAGPAISLRSRGRSRSVDSSDIEASLGVLERVLPGFLTKYLKRGILEGPESGGLGRGDDLKVRDEVKASV